MKYDFQDLSVSFSDQIEIDHFDDRPDCYGVVFSQSVNFPPGPSECRHAGGSGHYDRTCNDCWKGVDSSTLCPHNEITRKNRHWKCSHCLMEKIITPIKYQLIHNLHLGYRLLMNEDEGNVRDLPFHQGTEGFLPEGVSVEWKVK